MESTLFLSHVLSERTPGFGGVSAFSREIDRRISLGHSSNSETWRLSNHIGTHVDFPRHFSDRGRTVDADAAERLIFSNVQLVDCAVRADGLIGNMDLQNCVHQATDLLLIRTGFEHFRSEEKYWKVNPGILPELAVYWRSERPALRAIGFDFISLTAFQHRETGREAHRAFLDPERVGHPILIIEDMALSHLAEAPREVIVAPLRVQGADGAPVTVIARIG